jgi:glutamate racemase
MYASLVARFAQGVRVITMPAPELVLLAEAGAPDTDASRALVAKHVEPMLAAGADQIVLACTHFPFLIPLLRPLLGERATLVDPSAAVARQVGRVMPIPKPYPPTLAPYTERGINGVSSDRYFTTGDTATFSLFASRWMGEDVRAERIEPLD